jgi:hypothetical protein
MKVGRATPLFLSAVFGWVLPAFGQAPREDVIWARRSLNPITLDGVLNEAAWAQAESKTINWAQDAGRPGSGWKIEVGGAPSDPTRATLKFLVFGNQLYLGAVVPDASIGGSATFNRLDGFLMAVKDHADPNAPKPPAEYFYAWWYPTQTDPQPPGQPPAFIGRWATWPPGTPRDSTQVANWDAVTVVNGTSNTDVSNDVSYTVEMRFNLTPMGYDVTRTQGDIIEWNISIYDGDWFWVGAQNPNTGNRVWWQGPWGNDVHYNEVRVFARPSVTTASGPVPFIQPEVSIYEVDGTAPTIDGALSEPIWDDQFVYSFDIRYNDAGLRQTYPAVGPYRAGQYQPMVNGTLAPVVDPGDATVKMFFQNNTIYLGFDVRDQVVQFRPEVDRWDGFLVNINEKVLRGPDNPLQGRRLSFQVAQNGTALPQDYLTTLVASGDAQVAITLGAGTVVDTLGQTPDNGYSAELAIDLTALGYPDGLGDGSFYIGIDLADGDSFTPFTRSYGTRTWWFREYEGTCCPAWAHLATFPGVGLPQAEAPVESQAARSLPNPSPRPTIRYSMVESNRVTLEVFDIQGRLVERRELGVLPSGSHETSFDRDHLSDGVYAYRVKLDDPVTGASRRSLYGKLVLLR